MLKNKILRVFILMCCFSLLFACSNKKEIEEDSIIINERVDSMVNIGIECCDTLNPIFTKSNSVKHAMEFVFEPLFQFDTKLSPYGVLGKSVKRSNDGCTFTIELRDDVLWHDGSKFTANDVVHTFMLIKQNDTIYTKELEAVSSISVVDNNTIRVTLSRAVPNFCALMTFPIVKKGATGDADYIPCGTGAYKYAEKPTTDKIKLVKNENWHDTPPTLSGINITILKDKTAVCDAFNASEVDAITTGVMDLSKTTPRGDISSMEYLSNDLVFLGINNSNTLFESTNTRKAISYLIDKEDIVTHEAFSRAEAVDIPINPSAWYYPKKKSAKVDNDYIIDLLNLDGWIKSDGKFTRKKTMTAENGTQSDISQDLKFSILLNDDNEERLRIAQRIKAKFVEFGIECDINSVPFEEYSQKIQDKDYDVFLGEVRISKNMDLSKLLVVSTNYFSYKSGTMNDVCYKMGILSDADEIKNNYQYFYKIFAEDMPFVPLFFRKESVFFENCISGTDKPTMFAVFPNNHNWYVTKKKEVSR